MKACKIYCTYFGYGRGIPTGSPATPDDVLKMFKKNIENDMVLDCGVENMDIIVVNNYTNQITKEGQEYLKSIDGLNLPSGKIIMCERENIGASMGAFSYAFDKFSEIYDYWLFVEDDIRIIYPKYYKFIIDELDADDKLGFLALNYIMGEENPLKSCVCCGFGAAKKDVLLDVKKKYGKLPYDSGYNYGNVGSSEVLFTNCYPNMGYKMRLPLNKEINLLADNWKMCSTHIDWQNVKKFDLSNINHFCHIGL